MLVILNELSLALFLALVVLNELPLALFLALVILDKDKEDVNNKDVNKEDLKEEDILFILNELYSNKENKEYNLFVLNEL